MQGSQENQTQQQQSFYEPQGSPRFGDAPQNPPQQQTKAQYPSSLTWDASEYVENSKGILWLIALIVVFIGIAGVAYWLQAWSFLVLTVVTGVAMGILAFRPPRTVHYTLSNSGIEIDRKLFKFENYRAFGIIQEGAFFILMLVPIKRFMPDLNIYFKQDDGDQIISIIGSHLPLEDMKPDLVDIAMRKLHF